MFAPTFMLNVYLLYAANFIINFFVEVANLFPLFYTSQDRPTTRRQNKRMQLKVNGTDKKYRLVQVSNL